MTPVRPSYGGDASGMAGSCEPVVHGGPDSPSLDRRLAWTMMAGNQQKNAVAASNRLVEAAVDRSPGGLEIHSVEVEHAVRLDGTAAKLLVPAAVEGLLGNWDALRSIRRRNL